MKKLSTLICIVFLLSSLLSYSQPNVGIGTNNPHPSAKLDISSQQQGFLLPRLTSSQRDSMNITCACTPAEGLMIFNTTTKCFEAYVYNGWHPVSCIDAPPPVDSASGPDTAFIIPGTYQWTVPAGITSVCVVCVGGGAGSGYGGPGGTGGTSSFGTVCYGYGGQSGMSAPGGNFVGDGGGKGGNGADTMGGGGGAGGYTGNGGKGAGGLGTLTGSAGTGGAGGGGSQCGGGGCGGGGGVGLFGLGNNGAGACACCTIGGVDWNNFGHAGSVYNGSGSDGINGSWGSFGPGGFPGGGAAGWQAGGGGGLGYKNNIAVTPGQQITIVVGAGGAPGTQCNCGEVPGGGGAVRIIWGAGRSFPNNAH